MTEAHGGDPFRLAHRNNKIALAKFLGARPIMCVWGNPMRKLNKPFFGPKYHVFNSSGAGGSGATQEKVGATRYTRPGVRAKMQNKENADRSR